MNMKKDVLNKKLILLSLVLLSFVIINIAIAAAQSTNGDPNLSFFQRWIQSQITDMDAKLILFMMVAVILYVLFYSLTGKNSFALLLSLPITFVLTVFVTPNSFLGILRTYNTLPLLITSILPLIVLAAFSFLAIEKNKRGLLVGQHIVWWLYFIYLGFRFIAMWYAWGAGPLDLTNTFNMAVNEFAALPPPEQGSYFWMAFAIQFVIAGIMSFKNSLFTGIIGNSIEETQEEAGKRNARKVAAGIKNIEKTEEAFEAGSGI